MLQAVDLPPLDQKIEAAPNPTSNLDLLSELENPPTQTNGNSRGATNQLLDLLD